MTSAGVVIPRQRQCSSSHAPALGLALLCIPFVLHAQTVKPAPPPGSNPATVIAGKKYESGALFRFFFGGRYRPLWKTPITVPVLNLETYAGGLRATKVGGGAQTKSLRLENAEGVEYVFRSVNKDHVEIMPRLKGTVAETIMLDQVSSTHPGGALVAAALLDATTVLHVTPKLFVMPDDSVRLGEFQEDFAGRLGLLEEFPSKPKNHAGFAGAVDVVNSDDLLKLVNASPANRVDERAYLAARLMDMFLNDWDRHPGQWKWATWATRRGVWEPVPRDRDRAFVWYDGVIPKIARLAAANLVPFKPSYPTVHGLTFNSVELDRRLLSGLEWPVWDSVVNVLSRALTDSVIDASTRRMPPEYQASANALTETLKGRRQHLPDIARRFYAYLGRVVDLHATDASDHATIQRVNNDTVLVDIADEGGRSWFHRRFAADETDEIRLYLHDGDDRAIVNGDVKRSLPVRVIGGNGQNTLIDSSRVSGRKNPSHLYESGTVSGVHYGPDSMFARRPWIRERGKYVSPGRDFGHRLTPIFSLTADDDYGVVPRIGLSHYRYGFGRIPYQQRFALTVEYATGVSGPRIEGQVDQRYESSPIHLVATARLSDLEIIRFHGFGNDTPGGDATDFYDVENRQWSFQPAVAYSLGPKSDLYLGPVFVYSQTEHTPGRFITNADPYGSGDFGEAGARMSLHYDLRDQAKHPRRGGLFELAGEYFPATWDVRNGFGSVQASFAGYHTLPLPLRPILAIRGAAKKVIGDFPYFEAAFVGGGGSVRNLDAERFAGDASLNATAELRLPLAHVSFILPLDMGIFGLVDAGRVYQDGESPGGWHSAVGGGFWVGLLDPSTALSFAFTNGQERTGAFVRLGLAF